ncbi:MAG: hypothetical protein A2536_06445 [Candidatus Firestonebacteria bacterium RIFOXYD2_FULL_39_29]|nr:MAG: hypothetical protein A2536_06445 [Candidatus Firestonebacteria bacterium RIFOXYD2_FULL_39_29]
MALEKLREYFGVTEIPQKEVEKVPEKVSTKKGCLKMVQVGLDMDDNSQLEKGKDIENLPDWL